MTGNLAEYSNATDWDAEQVLAHYLLEYGKAKKAEIMRIVGEHLSEKQPRKYIDDLLDKGMLRKEGEREIRLIISVTTKSDRPIFWMKS